MNYQELKQLKVAGKALIEQTAEDGTVQLWVVGTDYYTVLQDNTVTDGKDEDFFQ